MAEGYSRKTEFPLRVYLASRVGRRKELNRYAEEIKERGHEVVSQWLWTPGHGITAGQSMLPCARRTSGAVT